MLKVEKEYEKVEGIRFSLERKVCIKEEKGKDIGKREEVEELVKQELNKAFQIQQMEVKAFHHLAKSIEEMGDEKPIAFLNGIKEEFKDSYENLAASGRRERSCGARFTSGEGGEVWVT